MSVVGCWQPRSWWMMVVGCWLLVVVVDDALGKAWWTCFHHWQVPTAWRGFGVFLLKYLVEQNGTLPNLEMFRGHDKASYTIPPFSIFFWQALFFCRPQNPLPPIKEIPSPQRVPGARCRTEVGCRHGQLVGSLPRSCGGRLDRIWPKPPKKNDNSGPNWKGWWWEWVNFMWIWRLKCICFKKKKSWFSICGWTSDKSFASPKTRKTPFYVFLKVYLASVHILVFGSLLRHVYIYIRFWYGRVF